MRESTRNALIASAEERARGFRPDVERSVAEGAAHYRSRLRRIYGITIAVLVVIAATLVVAYPAIGELVPRTTDTITVTPEAPTMVPGDSLTLEATVRHADGSESPAEDVEWSSSNWTVATVDSSGHVAAAAVGTAVITAQASGASGTATVTVVPRSALTAIALDPAEIELQPGQDVAITATGTYDDAETADLTASATWTSSDSAVATVDSSGRVSAVAGGTALISASAEGMTGTATVTVGDVELVGVRIDPARVQLYVGQAQPLTVVGEYSDGSVQPLEDPVTWTSSDTKSVQVDDAGVVTAITATTTSVITAEVRGFAPTATVEVLAVE